jgi:hypothetical protein
MARVFACQPPCCLLSALTLLPAPDGVYNVCMKTLTADFDGKVLVPDAPLDLAVGETVEVSIRRREEAGNPASELLARLPLIRIAPEDAEAINRDPAFDVEES